jgi:integral membrane protein
MQSAAIRHVRTVGLLEGASFLVLLAIAMPLKYLAGMPMAVSIVGMAHGVLFLLYLGVIGNAVVTVPWPYSRAALLVVAALLPFGPFLLDRRLRDEQHAAEARESLPPKRAAS